MNVAIYQPYGLPMAILCCASGLDLEVEARRVIPFGLPFWVVPKSDIDELYAKHGHVRCSWELNEDAIGRKPDGVGGAK